MRRLFLCMWLVVEFALICVGSYVLFGWIVERTPFLSGSSRFLTQGLPTICVAFLGLVMQFHPGYRLSVGNGTAERKGDKDP